jgi:FMN phosphatase YigB (HAD superfamily)
MAGSGFLKVVFFDLGETLVTQAKTWVPGAKNLLVQLSGKGVRLGVISNTGNLSRPDILKLLPADFDLNLFESKLVLFSSEVHVEKPAPAIFQLAIKRAGVPPDKSLFCTEDLLDTLAAQRAGMRTARVLKPASASDLASLVNVLTATAFLPS